jgi:LAO/AO transport system kinase
VRRGGKAALARALASLERAPDGPATIALLDAAYLAPIGEVIGVTGPPGVGKSTLLGRMIDEFRADGRRVGVIAVDPSSRRSGGALLGDRLRLVTDPEDPDVFVRSMAARDRLGGLAEGTFAAMTLMRALYDVVLIETVGVGQSETDVAGLSDTVVFCVQPASGDSLQFMKAGIVEIPHIAVVTKTDLGASATRALADLKGALSLAADGGEDPWPVAVLGVSAANKSGFDLLTDALRRRAAWLDEGNRRAALRAQQAEAWLRDSLRERFGREGLRKVEALGLNLTLSGQDTPFARLAEVNRQLLDQ